MDNDERRLSSGNNGFKNGELINCQRPYAMEGLLTDVQ